MTDEQWIEAVLAAGAVQRLHTERTIGRQTVGEHSWRVAMLLLRFHPHPSPTLLRAALVHDVAERWTGDVPAPAKWLFAGIGDGLSAAEAHVETRLGVAPWLENLSEDEARWLKACDGLCLLLTFRDEYRMGNRTQVANTMRLLERLREYVDAWAPHVLREYVAKFDLTADNTEHPYDILG